ncbi:hypothetical protein [Opitutus sp. GAS368]|uniref:hypothetical protein n=1 Tax=Opitutus sp. GAS368 TaxID=1882749 RepID=UPI00087B3425|nr:hypothetical protein [Opitutus sp. GAS368]SDR74974.1 hypothetical protein SAMN05444173_0721 [Opitutus sp. GAS368]
MPRNVILNRSSNKRKSGWAGCSLLLTWWVQYHTATSVFFHAFIAILTCIVTGYLASLVFARRAGRKNLRGLTLWTM